VSDAVTRLNAALEDRYVIERELGEGGMATVYLAEDSMSSKGAADGGTNLPPATLSAMNGEYLEFR
jgi:serine/threonine protein kinase